MNKRAEEAALKAYPIIISEHSDSCREYDINEGDRLVFQEGYEQAEKDSALTWEDIEVILDIVDTKIGYSIQRFVDEYIEEETFYKEVLKRYQEYRRKNNE